MDGGGAYEMPPLAEELWQLMVAERVLVLFSDVTPVANLIPCMYLGKLIGLSELFKNKQTKQQQQQKIKQRKGKV